MQTLKIAFRNLNRQKKRSSFLIIAIAFAVVVVVAIDGLFAGAVKNMELQVVKLVGGHVYIGGAQKSADKSADDKARWFLDKSAQAQIQAAADKLNINAKHIIKRSRRTGKLIFDSKESFLLVEGCDFAEEELLKNSLAFIAGGFENTATKNAILISDKTAEHLQVELFDTLLFETKTIDNQWTLVEFNIAGIYSQKSALGANSAYANRAYINEIYQVSPDSLFMHAFFLKDAKHQTQLATALERELGKVAKTTSRSKAIMANPKMPGMDLQKQLNRGKWENTKFIITSFYDYAPQLSTLLEKLSQISLGVLFVLLLITMLGVSNTFKIMVQERRAEIGTMRACGAGKNMIRRLFVIEALLLSMVATIIGFILALIVMQIISFIPIPTDSGFYIFTFEGFLSWQLSFASLSAKTLLILALVFASVLTSAVRAANMIPAHALRVGTK